MIHDSSARIKTQNLVIENSMKQYKVMERQKEEEIENQESQNRTINYHIDRVENEIKKLSDMETKHGEDLENIAEEVEKCQ